MLQRHFFSPAKAFSIKAFSVKSLLIGLFLSLIFHGTSIATEQSGVVPPVPVASDLAHDGNLARQERKPILLMFSAEDCEYCQRLEEDVIRPMLINGELQQRVILRKVMIDSIDRLKDFKGGVRNPDDFAYGRGVQVTPTLQFVDANGEQLMPQMIGYQSVDWFGAYLENAIGGSEQKLGASR